jgi:hypothetical protein
VRWGSKFVGEVGAGSPLRPFLWASLGFCDHEKRSNNNIGLKSAAKCRPVLLLDHVQYLLGLPKALAQRALSQPKYLARQIQRFRFVHSTVDPTPTSHLPPSRFKLVNSLFFLIHCDISSSSSFAGILSVIIYDCRSNYHITSRTGTGYLSLFGVLPLDYSGNSLPIQSKAYEN